MDNQSEVIQHQMEETRTSLQEKLETLEQQVKNTVQDATDAVAETVETVKDAVHDTVETVKDTVQGTVQSVRDSFDVAHHVETHPWAMFLGAAATGFCLTRWLAREDQPTAPQPAWRKEPAATAPRGNGYSAPAEPASAGIGSWIADHYKDELRTVKGLAFGAIGGLVRDVVTSMAPADNDEPAQRRRRWNYNQDGRQSNGRAILGSAPILSSNQKRRR